MLIGTKLFEAGVVEVERILTAEDSPAARTAGGWVTFAKVVHQGRFRRMPVLDGRQARGAVWAEVSGGHWVVRCPFCGLGCWAHETLPFVCLEGCGNQQNGYRPMAVRFPVMRRVIEGVLWRRPVVATRNWRVGETVHNLMVENRRHGII